MRTTRARNGGSERSFEGLKPALKRTSREYRVNKLFKFFLGSQPVRFNSCVLTYLIQHTRTQEYFQKGTWTLDSGWAEEFSDIANAIRVCLNNNLRDVELVLQFGSESGRNYSLHLTLPQQLLFA